MLRHLENELVGTIVSSIGTMISIGLNLSPIYLFYKYFKKLAPIQTIPEMMFVTGIFCCATNLAYGIIKGDKIITISNGVCYGLQILYGTTYIFITNNKRVDKLLLYLIIAWDLSFEVLFIFGNILEHHFGNTFALNFTGSFNIFIGVLNVITPGQNIIKVFKTGNFTLIPIVTLFFQWACSTLWGVYGFTDMDWNMIVPNLLGTILASIQIITYFYFYCKYKGKPPVTSETEEQGKEDEKDKLKGDETDKTQSTDTKPDNEQRLISDDSV